MRLMTLTVGPIAIITFAYWVAAPPSPAAEISVVTTAPTRPLPAQRERGTFQDMAVRCQVSAQRLQQVLPADFQIVIRAPFLIAGDLSPTKLQQVHSEVIGPVARALRATYFLSSPHEPITIVICSTEVLFRRLAKDWDGQLEAGYHGYYRRDKRRILLDLEAGNGSLAHELTHALSHADCEELPEWFDEGLGALHEEAAFAANGQRLIGLPNWRCTLTRQAAQSGQLPTLHSLTNPTTFRSADVGLNYAVARSFCLFLQERQVLKKYYQELRNRSVTDAEGITTLCRVLEMKTVSQVERQFATWVKRRAAQ